MDNDYIALVEEQVIKTKDTLNEFLKKAEELDIELGNFNHLGTLGVNTHSLIQVANKVQDKIVAMGKELSSERLP